MSNNVKHIIVNELPRLRRFAYSLTGIKEDADDLLQSVVERLLERGIPDDADVKQWCYRVCKNMWIDEIRRREVRRRAMGESHDDCVLHESGEADYIREQDVKRVKLAMNTLPESQRIVLCLVAVEEMSYAEAAAILEVPVGTVMSRLSRARQKLVDKLGESLVVDVV